MTDHLDLEAIKDEVNAVQAIGSKSWVPAETARALISEVERQDAVIKACERSTEIIRLVQQRDDARAEVERLQADVERKDAASGSLREIIEEYGPIMHEADPSRVGLIMPELDAVLAALSESPTETEGEVPAAVIVACCLALAETPCPECDGSGWKLWCEHVPCPACSPEKTPKDD